MSKYEHRVCERCWFDGDERLVKLDEGQDGKPTPTFDLVKTEAPGVITSGENTGAYRQPVQVDSDPGACCICGGMTITGIFYRHDPEKLLCLGRHEPEQLSTWSRVVIE